MATLSVPTPATSFTVDLKTFILSHTIWIVGVIVALVGFHCWVQEHDQRLQAESAVKAAQVNIVQLQRQIDKTNAQAAQQVQTIVKIVHDVQTPTQAIPAIPQLTNVPLNARVLTDNPIQVGVDAVPLIQLLGQAKQDAVNLTACQSDLKNETAIAVQKDDQIKALTKKPAFLHRLGNAAKTVGVGIAIGIAIVALH